MDPVTDSTTLYVRDFRLAEWWVRPSLNRLERDGEAFQVEPKSMDVLVDLAEHAGEVRSKRRLLHVVWGNAFVTDDVLTHAVCELRKVLGDDAKDPKYIETIPRKGYRLIAQKTDSEKKAFRYQILDKLGGGGMGVVYKAKDTLLGRTVALKFLPAELSEDSTTKERFLREARAAARLAHPNIAVVHDVGEDPEGRMFIAMDCYDGETIKKKIARGPLPIDQSLDLGEQIARGLAAAHAQGIVHRDIKPANVMVTKDGEAKILDFGLAKLKPAEAEEYSSQLSTQMMTQEGCVRGTYPYMSPEQAQGKTVDQRSDLFSFGSMLYEMATGTRAFAGDSPASLLGAILKDEPPPLVEHRDDLPKALGQILEHCLEKDPDKRYRRAKDLQKDLDQLRQETLVGRPVSLRSIVSSPGGRKWRLAAGFSVLLLVAATVGLLLTRPWEKITPPVELQEQLITSLAVLPLANLSGDPEQEYFAAGITEGLISDLGGIAALRVISRQSVMRYKDSDKALPVIAKELGVEALIEGSVLGDGDRVRITAQLVQANPEQHLWAGTYDSEAKDILTLLSDVTRAIVAEVQVVISPEEQSRLRGAVEVDLEAHQAYLKGKFLFDQFSHSGAFRAQEHYRHSIAVDPSYAPAWAGLAEVNLSLAFWLMPWDSEGRVQAAVEGEAALKKTLALDDSLAQAHTLMGQVYAFRSWDWENAETEYQRAIELGPSNSGAHISYAYFLSAMGRHEEALRVAERAELLDPLSPLIFQKKGNIHRNIREFDKALEYYEKALKWTPDNPWILAEILFTHGIAGRSEEYAATAHDFRSLLAKIPDPPDRQRVHQRLAEGFDGATMAEATHLWLAETKDPTSPIYMEGGPILIAFCHALLGENEEALEWLEESFTLKDDRSKSVRLSFVFLGVDPAWDDLRSNPRFQNVIARMNFPD